MSRLPDIDLRHVGESPLERRPVGTFAQPDVADHEQVPAERARVEVGPEGTDHTAGAQPPDPVGHGVGGEPDRLAQLLVRRPGVLVQQPEQGAVDGIHAGSLAFSRSYPTSAAESTVAIGTRTGSPHHPHTDPWKRRDDVEIVLRLTLPPLVVLLAGWAQHRVGTRLSGRLVGLPLTSGPFLLALLHAQGPDAAARAAGGVVAGQLVVVAAAGGYALAAAGRTPCSALGRTLPVAAGIALLAGQLTSPVIAFAIAVTVVLVVLLRWRPTPVDPTAGSSGAGALASRELAGRAVVAGGLVALLTLAAPLLGAHLAGLLAAVPLVIGVMAQTTHASSGVASVRSMLRGDRRRGARQRRVRGRARRPPSASLPVGVAFGGAVTALLVVNAGVARVDVAAWRKR